MGWANGCRKISSTVFDEAGMNIARLDAGIANEVLQKGDVRRRARDIEFTECPVAFVHSIAKCVGARMDDQFRQ